MPRLYIADGHHRSAAASRIHAQRGADTSRYFLAGLYPSDQLQVLAYNRVVHDLNGHTEASLLDALAPHWGVMADGQSTPQARGEVSMYLGGSWYTLCAKPDIRSEDPVNSLDVAMLQNHVLRPLLGIEDPRRSTRIDFVGGIHGPAALAAAVDAIAARGQGPAVAFHLFPTALEQLFSVADAGQVMPPKSTWFEPKLREGVAVRRL